MTDKSPEEIEYEDEQYERQQREMPAILARQKAEADQRDALVIYRDMLLIEIATKLDCTSTREMINAICEARKLGIYP